ncbi:MAG: hypothetical protein A2481_00665 [Candidatus Yonathbacteria bacterium RIFOXYC2_FULL_47_9]|nr:MAG: hypothetical protein A2481_00665 [Candidatus Yonathbacteria bacterium RIFOXYC2_FULL_47_9]
MIAKMYWIQTGALLVGTVFAWTTAVVDFLRFYEAEGTLFKINDCLYPNPVTTSCFYGAIAFAVALVWAISLVKKEGEVRAKSEKYLVGFLVAGTIFAWTSFGRLVYNFYTALPGAGVGCSGVPAASPFVTPCFFGSMLFFIALVVSFITLAKEAKSEAPVI